MTYRASLDTWPGGSHMWVAGSKQWIDPFTLRIHQVEIDDIALALSRICRYTGHVQYPLTVAEHSVNVANRVTGFDNNGRLAALLHDAAEAYLSDVPKPIKDRPEMKWFRDLEDELLFEVIYPRFGVVCTPSSELWKAIKKADYEVFQREWANSGGEVSFGHAHGLFLQRFNNWRYGT